MSTIGIKIDAPEHDAGVRRGRTQREIDLFSGVQPDAGGANDVLQRALLDHVNALPQCGLVSRRPLSMING